MTPGRQGALLALALCLAGCSGPTRVEDERVPGHLLPPPVASPIGPDAPGGAPTQERRLRFERPGERWQEGSAALPLLHISSRALPDVLPSGLPRPGAAEAFHWASAEPPNAWPFLARGVLPMDRSTWLFAWQDVDGDAALSAGDPLSSPIAPLADVDPGVEIVFRLDRRYLPPGEAALRDEPRDVVIVTLSDDARAHAAATVLLTGYRRQDVSSLGLPDRPAPPILRWSSSGPPLRWPLRVRLDPEGAADVQLVAALDLDGDGVMSPGDLVGTPDCGGFPSEEARPCTVQIDQALPGSPPP